MHKQLWFIVFDYLLSPSYMVKDPHLHLVTWRSLSYNPNATPGHVDGEMASLNLNAIYIIEENPDRVRWAHWPTFKKQTITQLNTLKWHSLSLNSNAVQIMQANVDIADWYWLSSNPRSIHILEKNYDKVILHDMPTILRSLQMNPSYLHWSFVSAEPFIFQPEIHEFINVKNSLVC